ncbi:MAG: antibiotic biosynthesis monooxygenase [Chitinophagales bacterium]
MIKTLMYHKVQDFNKWKEAFEGFADIRKAAGELSYSIGTLHNEPNTAYVINSWESIEKFEAFVGTDDLKAVMGDAGVLEAPHTII